MSDYNVVWSREAIYDVADIADYIELRFGKERADRFNAEIDAEGEALGHNFRMYTGTGIYYRKKLILKKLFDPSILFYFVDDLNQEEDYHEQVRTAPEEEQEGAEEVPCDAAQDMGRNQSGNEVCAERQSI